jgi:serine protease AprX
VTVAAAFWRQVFLLQTLAGVAREAAQAGSPFAVEPHMPTSRHSTRRAIPLSIFAVIVTLTTTAAAAQESKLDPVLQMRAGQLSGWSRVIVEFTGARDIRAITAHRGRVGRRLGQHAQVADVENLALAAVAADPRVARIMIDRPAFPTLFRTGATIGATGARLQFDVTGRGVGVAIIDSGIAAWHDDLYLVDGVTRTGDRVVHFKDFTRDDAASTGPDLASDDYGHGTHVAGTIAGSGYDSGGARSGIAPGAHLVALKVLDAEGNGYISDVIAAFEYAIEHKEALGIRIINLSVASGVFESYRRDPLTLAARRAVEAGIVVVAAAGNLGANEQGEVQYGGITSPGNAPWVLTVGAASHMGTLTRSDDAIAAFSSRGPTWIDFVAKPDLVAPGVGIESAAAPNSTLAATMSAYLLSGTVDSRFQPYLSMSGTSMATPVVAGTVALMLEANPQLTPNAVKAILQYTAQVKEGESPLAQGAGLLNAAGAIRMARFFGAPDTDLGVTADTIEGEQVAWSQHIIWGNYSVTGGIPLPGSNAWEPGLVWGTMKADRGEPVVWGARFVDRDAASATGGRDNIIWATGGRDNIIWATGGRDNIIWATGGRDNIIWATGGRDNIIWATGGRDNIIWATGGRDNIIWATGGRDNIIWATGGRDNIIWATGGRDNIIWATGGRDNIIWATAAAENVVWGSDCDGRDCVQKLWGADENGTVWGTAVATDNTVWAAAGSPNMVWATAGYRNIMGATAGNRSIVWATGSDGDEIVWTAAAPERVVWPTGGH